MQDLQQNILDLEAGREKFTFSNGTEYKIALKVLVQKTVEAKTEEAAARLGDQWSLLDCNYA